MDFSHPVNHAWLETLQRRVFELAVVTANDQLGGGGGSASNNSAIISSNGTAPVNGSSHDPMHEVQGIPESELHRAMLAPWVLGVAVQAVFTGVILSQAHSLYLDRRFLSRRMYATATLLAALTAASFGSQAAVLWFFSMSSLGEMRYLVSKLPLSLVVDLWITPIVMGLCNLVQLHYVYKDSHKRLWILSMMAFVWCAEIVSSILNMVLTTQSFHGRTVDSKFWGYASYIHLTTRLASIFLPACLRLYYPLRRGEISFDTRRCTVDILGLIFRSGILGAIPAAVETESVLRELRLSVPANVAYTCTPRVCTSAVLASFLYVVQRRQDAESRTAFTRDVEDKQFACLPVFNSPVQGNAPENESIEFA